MTGMETDKSNIEAVHHNHPGRWLLMGFCVALVFLCARVLVESSAAFDRGHSALSASDEPAAVFHFRTAAKSRRIRPEALAITHNYPARCDE